MSQIQSQDLWLIFPFFFVGMWLVVSASISRDGWRSFAERYPASNRPAGQSYVSPRTRFAGFYARYGNVVRVIFTDDGVYFSVLFLFRAFHSPFLVPWRSVARVERERGFFGDRYRLDIEDAAGEIHVILPLSIEHDLSRFKRAA
jgi:hypothetical protein